MVWQQMHPKSETGTSFKIQAKRDFLIMSFLTFNGPVWRLLSKDLLDTPSAPARAPAGRFHHSGQVAAYASLSAEGTHVAIKRYLADGVERVLVPMWLTADRVADLRGNRSASIVWQDIHEEGRPSPTWEFSDRARAAGAQALLYSSRSRPDLSHVVVFEPYCLSLVNPTTDA